jgi:hypothetical protein
LTIVRALGKSTATQRLQEIAAGIVLAANDGRDPVVSHVDKRGEYRRSKRLLEAASKGAERHFAVCATALTIPRAHIAPSTPICGIQQRSSWITVHNDQLNIPFLSR